MQAWRRNSRIETAPTSVGHQRVNGFQLCSGRCRLVKRPPDAEFTEAAGAGLQKSSAGRENDKASSKRCNPTRCS
jgi:hypothetical protein